MIGSGRIADEPVAAPVEPGGIRFVPGLDGLRGVAVLSVMAFHAGLSWAAGGLLGVDVFFVLSGFLVTSILLGEHARTGTLALRRFWARRARRLLPALAVLLLGICAYAEWVNGGVAPEQLRGDALSTLAYVANWHYILTGQNYFVRYGGLSPLLHTWSLAVEEQFYLVWPLIALVVLKRAGRRGLGWVAGVIGASSAAVCAALYLTGASVDRLYYGTDTRAQSIMIGALLAVLVPLSSDRRPAPSAEVAAGSGTVGTGVAAGSGTAGSRVAAGSGTDLPADRAGAPDGTARAVGWSIRLVGVVGLVGAGVLAYCLHAVQGSGAFLYEGGFLIVGLSTASLVTLVVWSPNHVLSRVLSWRPLRYVGRISYGLYLYHWPLFLVLDQSRTGLSGVSLLALRVAVTFAVADLSYRLVEQPIRSRRPIWPRRAAGRDAEVAGRAPAMRRRQVRRHRVLVPVGLVGGAVALVALVVVATATPGTPALLPTTGRPPAHFVGPGGADAAHPEHALLLGDSIALTLGEGLDRDDTAWGIAVDNKGAVGCDLDPTTTVNVMGSITIAAQGCPHWRTAWASLIARTNPDVVVVLLGRWETIDRLYDGRWTSVGAPAFDRHLRAELGQLIDIVSARGAKVVFLTLPYIAQTTEQPDGAPWDMNLPSRTNAYNADVRAAVAAHPNKAVVLDLNKMLDPDGQYTSYVDGVRVRSFDDEHISLAGGELLRGELLPSLLKFGAAHYEARVAHGGS